MKRLVMAAMAVMAFGIEAMPMPTKEALKNAQPLLAELMSDDMAALKAKKKSSADVADAAVKYAEEAQTAAAKFMLLRSAVQYYARDEKYDQAATTVEKIYAEFPEIQSDVIAEVIGKAVRGATSKKAPKLYAQWEQAMLRVNAGKEVKTLAERLKQNPSAANRRKYGEALAASGDWKNALGEFAQIADMKICQQELDGKAKDAVLGEFWWKYKPENDDYESAFKSHAAVFYRRAIASGEISALQKKLVEKRIADIIETEIPGEVSAVRQPIEPRQEEQAKNGTEKARRDLARMFPGWSLVSEVDQNPESVGFVAEHRGQKNVIRFHPVNLEATTTVVLSRTVKLTGKNPCLMLKVSSFVNHADFVLSVLVDGTAALPDRLIRTQDSAPWEDLVVPLSDWRGKTVKIEIIHKVNGRWCEWSQFARIEIVEGNGKEKCGLDGAVYGKQRVGGCTWSYRVQNGEATIVAENAGVTACAVDPSPKGNLVIPARLGGAKVVCIGQNAFNNCREISSVSIPEGVIGLDNDAFNNCKGLKAITLPRTVTTVGSGAFADCNALASVTIPSGLKSFGNWTFAGCSALTDLTIPGERPIAQNEVFAGCKNLKAIHVPANAKSWAGMDKWCGVPLVFDAK